MDSIEKYRPGAPEAVRNESGLRPLGHAVLVKPYELEYSGTIEIPDVVKTRTDMVEQRAVVIEVGPECWKDETRPRAVVGDRVLVSKYSGHLAKGPLDGKWYRLVNARDVFAGIVEEAQNG